MNTLILGNGFIGKVLFNELPFNNLLNDLRINEKTSTREICEIIKVAKSDILINCIGKTGRPNVDWCEDNKAETYFSNVKVPLILQEACELCNIKMIQIGSGCIYNGDNNGQGFSEEDEPNFYDSYYSKTKIECEKYLKSKKNVLITRIRMPITDYPDERNLIDKLLKYDKIICEPNSVTCIKSFVYALKELINKDLLGIFNIVNPGIETHDIILKKLGVEKKYIKVDALDKMTKAKRSNCLLSDNKLKKYDINLKPFDEVIEEVIENYQKYRTVS